MMSRCSRYTSAVLAAALAFAGLTGAFALDAAAIEPLRVAVPQVELVDADGARRSLPELLATSEPVALQFIFTTCAGVCPTLSATLAELARRVPAVHRVSISIDPTEDTPARLREYRERFGGGARGARGARGGHWTLLTGTAEDAVAVQQAFGAYRGDKMRHLPLTFLRPAGAALWLRVEGPVSAAELAETLQGTLRADALLGKRLYREGILASGEPLTATVHGDVPLVGGAAACASCHRSSGFGGVEAGLYVPPITAPWLFSEREPRRIDVFRELFQEELSPAVWARLRARGHRPPYTAESLGSALAKGTDSAGRALDGAMPRYALAEADLRHLTAYLQTLAASPSPGANGAALHLALLLAADADGRNAAMVRVAEAFIRQKNADTARRRERPADLLRHEDEWPPADRLWRLHLWRLGPDEKQWPAELAASYRAEPVFVLLGEASEGTRWAVSELCESEELPCLLLCSSAPQDRAPQPAFALCYFKRQGPAAPEPPQAFRTRQWLRARGIPHGPHEEVELGLHYLLTLVEAGLMHVGDDFSRPYLQEAIAREAGRVPNPGPYGR